MPVLPTNLNTNEVKNSAGTEVEFTRYSSEGRTLIFAKASEVPSEPHRLKISHQETGTGSSAVRRSLCRIDMTVPGLSGKNVVVSAYAVLVIPIGELGNLVDPTNAMAELNSFLSTTGAGTTVLFDGSGSGTSALINGTM